MLHFLKEIPPSFQGISLYKLKGSILRKSLKHTSIPYYLLRTAVYIEGYFLKGMTHHLKRNILYTCMYIRIYIYIYLNMFYSELYWFKINLYVAK